MGIAFPADNHTLLYDTCSSRKSLPVAVQFPFQVSHNLITI
jgi:hypothetical protein